MARASREGSRAALIDAGALDHEFVLDHDVVFSSAIVDARMSMLVAGVDVGGTNIEVGLVDEQHMVQSRPRPKVGSQHRRVDVGDDTLRV